MKVYKFGGASVKDALSVKNVFTVLQTAGYDNCFLVISAMGKTTNNLEGVVVTYFNQLDYFSLLEKIKINHIKIAKDLFTTDHAIFNELELLFIEIESFLKKNKSPNYNFVYDQVVGYGELMSTKIVHTYLQTMNLNSVWLDSREYIKTDNNYREGNINWKKTEENFKKLSKKSVYLTQGFLGSDENYMTVTLGREGSDYSAAIIAYCINAESLTIWKDVPGILNGDPKYFQEIQLLKFLSYTEAVELAYYGASIIHPKTLKPLENKEIPFYIKSFIKPNDPGTVVRKGQKLIPLIPCFILKKNQYLIEISSLNFSFITEEHIGEIFEQLANLNIKVNIIQTSALCLLLCLEDVFANLPTFILHLSSKFKFNQTQNVSIYTIRHFTEEAKEKIIKRKKVLLEQIVKENIQIVIKE